MDIINDQPCLYIDVNYQRTVVRIQTNAYLKCTVLNVFQTHLQVQWMNLLNVTVFYNSVDSKLVDQEWKIRKLNKAIESGDEIMILVKKVEED